MKHRNIKKAEYILVLLALVCLIAMCFIACGSAGSDRESSEGGTEVAEAGESSDAGSKASEAGESSGADSKTTEAGESSGADASDAGSKTTDTGKESAKPKTLRLKSGAIIELDKKGRITGKSVMLLKTGTKITKKEIKKTGGVSRYFRSYDIEKDSLVYIRIFGKSYRENPDIKLKDLQYVKTLYHDFDGKVRVGEIIVNRKIADDTKAVFRELYGIKYQIRKMQLVDHYWVKGADGTVADTASMNDDNTSGFNYRMVAGTSTVSMHGYGRAIDVNPFENPWCPNGKLYPNQARSAEYANRSVRKPHMIFSDSKITAIFKKHGFRWLGEAKTRDYQHFEK